MTHSSAVVVVEPRASPRGCDDYFPAFPSRLESFTWLLVTTNFELLHTCSTAMMVDWHRRHRLGHIHHHNTSHRCHELLHRVLTLQSSLSKHPLLQLGHLVSTAC